MQGFYLSHWSWYTCITSVLIWGTKRICIGEVSWQQIPLSHVGCHVHMIALRCRDRLRWNSNIVFNGAVCWLSLYFFRQLLTAFVSSSSLMLLEVLITVICRESEHIHEDQIQRSLAAFIQRQVHLRLSAYKYQEPQDKIWVLLNFVKKTLLVSYELYP